MKWEHLCSLDWMEARRRCLTATDVLQLLPYTKTGRKRTITEEDYLKVFARKVTPISIDDCYSTGAAARGHILEPYAIDYYNEIRTNMDIKLFHWDDIVIYNKTFGKRSYLGFSPDALCWKQIPGKVSAFHNEYGISTGPLELGEVKSYSAERHLASMFKAPKEMEERWQIAVAMCVLPYLTKAKLILFAPQIADKNMQMFVYHYDRSDLKDEIDTIYDVFASWETWLRQRSFSIIEPQKESELEKMIMEDIERKNRLNP